MNPITQKLQNELHRQCPAELKQQAVGGDPTVGNQGAVCLGSEYRASAVQTTTGSKDSPKNWQWHTKAVVHTSLDTSFPQLCIQKVPI